MSAVNFTSFVAQLEAALKADPGVSLTSDGGNDTLGTGDLGNLTVEPTQPEGVVDHITAPQRRTQDKPRRLGDVTWKAEDDELQIVWGEVYIPMVPDSQGDFMTADEIRKMAYRFMAKKRTDQIDIEHDNEDYSQYVVESFIARDGDPTFVPGAWVLAVHIPDPAIWQKVKDGELNGFSLQAEARGEDRMLDIEIPEKITGMTEVTDGHAHQFDVRFGPDGQFLGGKTGFVDGHFHLIRRGTITEPAMGHSHRFNHVDEIVGANVGHGDDEGARVV